MDYLAASYLYPYVGFHNEHLNGLYTPHILKGPQPQAGPYENKGSLLADTDDQIRVAWKSGKAMSRSPLDSWVVWKEFSKLWGFQELLILELLIYRYNIVKVNYTCINILIENNFIGII